MPACTVLEQALFYKLILGLTNTMCVSILFYTRKVK